MNVKFSIDGLEEPVLKDIKDYEWEWVEYIYNFYGEGGIYAEEFFPEIEYINANHQDRLETRSEGVSISEIILAMKVRNLIIDEPFDGSIDREIVRDIMLEARFSDVEMSGL